MKKFLTVVVATILAICSLSLFACDKKEETLNPELNFICPDGAPALSIAKYIYDNSTLNTNSKVNYKIVNSGDLGAIMSKGEADIIVVPVNASSKLYKANKQDTYKMISVITHGNLYLVSTKDITVNDLKDEKIGVIGQGLVPDLTFRYALQKNNAVANNLTYFEKATDVVRLMKTGGEDGLETALLPEPALSNLIKSTPNRNFVTIIDLGELYDSEIKTYPQAVLMVKESVLENNKEILTYLKESFESNITWTKANAETAVNAINEKLKEGAVPSLVAKTITSEVVDRCNIFWQGVKESKEQVKTYIDDIIRLDNQSAKQIEEEYFYIEK